MFAKWRNRFEVCLICCRHETFSRQSADHRRVVTRVGTYRHRLQQDQNAGRQEAAREHPTSCNGYIHADGRG